jgi:hypothetical protein
VEYEGRPSGREGIVGGCGMARRGVRGDSQQGKKVKVSSSQRPVNKNSVARMAWMVCSRFKYLCSDAEKKATMEIEEVVKFQRKNTTKEVIVE